MNAPRPMAVPAHNDADLVHASLAGDRGAFGKIVARYQSLVCSLAYSATGNLNRSEELAQDTFVAAWKQLPELREPASLRAWLCGIARNLTRNAQRRVSREPAHLAEPFDPAHDAVAPEPSPCEQAVSQEEAALLWRALEKIPENYREPLVLFYREHRSVESVARELELSEDAVKQRLSRGRALLHEQVLALVEGTLTRSNPGQAFTLGVMSALPAIGTGVAATAGLMATTKASAATNTPAATKAAASAGGVGITAMVFGLLAALGGYIGWQMGDAKAQSSAERLWVGRFWRLVVVGFVGCLLPAFIFTMGRRTYPWMGTVATGWIWLLYAIIVGSFAMYAWRHHRRIHRHEPAASPVGSAPRKRFIVWVALGTLCMAVLLVFSLGGGGARKRVAPAEVQALVAAHPDAKVYVSEYENGMKSLMILVRDENDHVTKYVAVWDEPMRVALQQSGVTYHTVVQGRDFEIFGWAGRYLFVLAVVLMAAGVVTLVRTLRRGKPISATAAPANPPGN